MTDDFEAVRSNSLGKLGDDPIFMKVANELLNIENCTNFLIDLATEHK